MSSYSIHIHYQSITIHYYQYYQAEWLVTYRVCQKKWPKFFCQNFVKSPPNLIIFGTQTAKTIELC